MNLNKLYSVIEGQLVTEKSVKLTDKYKSISFIVSNNSNKYDVKFAVEKIFNVKVSFVNILNVKSKSVKFKNIKGKTKKIKKAIVYLKKGYDINLSDFN